MFGPSLNLPHLFTRYRSKRPIGGQATYNRHNISACDWNLLVQNVFRSHPGGPLRPPVTGSASMDTETSVAYCGATVVCCLHTNTQINRLMGNAYILFMRYNQRWLFPVNVRRFQPKSTSLAWGCPGAALVVLVQAAVPAYICCAAHQLCQLNAGLVLPMQGHTKDMLEEVGGIMGWREGGSMNRQVWRGGGVGSGLLGHILTSIPRLGCPVWATPGCMNLGAILWVQDPSSPTELTRAYPWNISPCPAVSCSCLLVCVRIQCRLGLRSQSY